MNIEFVDQTDARRFELRPGEEVLGFMDYRLSGGVITMVHTEVDPANSGEGYAGKLTRAALDHARERGLAVVPMCPYVASWIEKHTDYADLVKA